MACKPCSGVPSGYSRVWQFVQVGKPTREFETQGEALRAQQQASGSGRIQSLTRRDR